MKGLVFVEPGKVELREVDKPELIHPQDAIVKITATTICGSDVHLAEGHLPTTPGYVMGHEYVGEVVETGNMIKNLPVGTRVAGPAAPYCGQCPNCRDGNISHCMNGGVHGSGPEFGNLPGTHSEYIRVPFAELNLVPVPANVTDEQALFVGDILSTGFTGVLNGKVSTGDTVVVFGAGPVGISAVMTAGLFGAGQVILVGNRDEYRLEIGKEAGADVTILGSKENVLERIGELTGGRGADVVIDAAGSASTVQNSLRCARIGGHVALLALYPMPIEFPMPEIGMKNLTITMGLGNLGYMRRLMALISKGSLDPSIMVSHRFPLSEAEEAYRVFKERDGNVLKVILKPGE